VLAESGEMIKARELMRTVPWFVAENGAIVRRRGEIEREIRGRQTLSLPEDEDADELVQRLSGALA
jgi:hypothetical protein